MNPPISIALCCLVLASCNDMITRWWNSGPYMHISAKEKKAEDEQKNDPKLYEEWRAKVYIPKDIECMRRKGY